MINPVCAESVVKHQSAN